LGTTLLSIWCLPLGLRGVTRILENVNPLRPTFLQDQNIQLISSNVVKLKTSSRVYNFTDSTDSDLSQLPPISTHGCSDCAPNCSLITYDLNPHKLTLTLSLNESMTVTEFMEQNDSWEGNSFSASQETIQNSVTLFQTTHFLSLVGDKSCLHPPKTFV
jgi:hypothetical protein